MAYLVALIVVLGVNAQGRGLERLDAGAIRHARTAHGDLGIEVIMADALAGQRSVGLSGDTGHGDILQTRVLELCRGERR